MIYVLYALLIGLAWALSFILQWSLWIAAGVTLVILLVALGTFVFLRVRANRSAGALERAIAEQAKQQEANASPQKRAEIQALQKQILDGINALKQSKLGGKKRGASALYSLPWYAIIGPPGAGKTTALKASGLQFPYADSSIRGVGGTRNCDWWFTNDAILLDTAGRYTTEHEDQSEWLSFLDMLRKHRSQKPLNGLIVAVSVPDIIDANEMQIESMGKKLRARIDEVMTKLGMVLPVYVLVTKCDLVAGFNEFFADLRKSDRAQALGATIPLGADRRDPGGMFAREFDLLVQQLHARGMKRLASERDRKAREAIYGFPLEFAGLRRNLADLLGQVFMVNAFQGTPTFRGFYFTSGTQEGAPLGRVLMRMGQAMGIQPKQYEQQQRIESKSYFLFDVFTRVVFPDADVAARSNAELRRQQLVRVGVSAAALALAVSFAGPSVVSFLNNREFLQTAQQQAEKAMKIDWDNRSEPIRAKLEVLDPLRKTLSEIEGHQRDGVPFNMRFLMYSGEEVYPKLVAVYVYNMQKGFVSPAKFKLESELSAIKGEKYANERSKLKTYLMLSDVTNLDVDFATGRYTALWSDINKSTNDISMIDLKKRMQPLLLHYFQLIKPDPDRENKARAKPVPANDKVVERAREVLQSVPVRKRYLALFVDTIEVELYDESEDAVRGNLRYPPLSLDTMFSDRKEVLAWLKSAQSDNGKGYFQVGGPYTDKGHAAVLSNIDVAKDLLEREQWVVPLTPEEQGEQVARNIALLAEDYEQNYIATWKGFLQDIRVRSPNTLDEAIKLYGDEQGGMRRPEWPFLRILRALEDHTQWKKPLAALEDKRVSKIANQKLNQQLSSRSGGLSFNVDVNKIAGKSSKVPQTFKSAVNFGVPPEGSKNPLNETPLSDYMELLNTLKQRMLSAQQTQRDASVNAVGLDVNKAISSAEALLKPLDQLAQSTLLPLLMAPLNVGGKMKVPTSIQ
ncbi:MAG: type VI secretion system membrane subunit TssM [Deltaproteobacteria bacterium]|nr:type VI secretion system membrane subunit TssM [Deltaproteobacteria bacterium]